MSKEKKRIFLVIEPNENNNINFFIFTKKEITKGMLENNCSESEFLEGELSSSEKSWIELPNTEKNRTKLKALLNKMEVEIKNDNN